MQRFCRYFRSAVVIRLFGAGVALLLVGAVAGTARAAVTVRGATVRVEPLYLRIRDDSSSAMDMHGLYFNIIANYGDGGQVQTLLECAEELEELGYQVGIPEPVRRPACTSSRLFDITEIASAELPNYTPTYPFYDGHLSKRWTYGEDDVVPASISVTVGFGVELWDTTRTYSFPLPGGGETFDCIEETIAHNRLCFVVSADVSAVETRPHPLPATVAAADADLSARQRNIIGAWVRRYGHGMFEELRPREDPEFPATLTGYAPRTYPLWNDSSQTVLAMLGAGAAVFARPELWSGDAFTIAGRKLLMAELSGLDVSATVSEHLGAWQADTESWLLGLHEPEMPQAESYWEIQQFKDVGTKLPGEKMTSAISGDSGNYDFTLADSIAFVYAYREHPDVVSNALVRRLITHGKVEFLEDANGCSVVAGQVPFSGQDPTDWLAVGPNGIGYTRKHDTEAGIPYTAKVSVSETENHVASMYAWRYLAQDYIKWTTTGAAATAGRADPCLAALIDERPDLYDNDSSPELTDFLVNISARVLRKGEFETNGKVYESFFLPPLMYLSSYAASLFPTSPARQRVQVAAQNAVDFLAADFAVQSFEGKRVAPIRRSRDNGPNVHPHHNDNVPDLFGVLTGAYKFDDSSSLGELEHCASAADCDSKPYLDGKVDTNALHALQSALLACRSGQTAGCYRVPAPIHDLMLNKHTGYWGRIQTHYYYPSDYSFHWSIGLGSLLSSAPEPAAPLLAYPWYEASPPPSLGGFRPVTQFFFAGGGFVNSAGGVYRQFNPLEVCGSVDHDLSGLPLEASLVCGDLINPLIGAACGAVLEAVLGGDLCASQDKLRDLDALAKPNTVLGRGYLWPESNSWQSLADQTLVMPGDSNIDGQKTGSQNLDVYKNFTYGYFYDPVELSCPRGPHFYPASWDNYFVAEETVGSAKLEFFDFTALIGHPLMDHYVVLGRTSCSSNPRQAPDPSQPPNSNPLIDARTISRGFWEIIPRSQFPGGIADVRDAVLSNNPSTFFPSSGNRKYRLTSTQEVLTLNPNVGEQAFFYRSELHSPVHYDYDETHKFENGIVEIRDAVGAVIPADFYRTPAPGSSAVLPLMEVWPVDSRYNFRSGPSDPLNTDDLIAYAAGDGRFVFNNLATGQGLVLDSSNILGPTRLERTFPPRTDLENAECASDSQCNIAGNEYCDNGTCWVRACNPASPFGSIAQVLSGATSTDGFTLSPDGLKAFFSRKAPGASNYDLYFAQRETTTSPFSPLSPVQGPVNSNADERAPFVSADLHRLYYWTKNTSNSNSDLMVATRTGTSGAFQTATVVGGPNNNVNSPVSDEDPFLLDDEKTLYFTSDRPTGDRHLYVVTKGTNGLFGTPQILSNLVTSTEDSRPVVTRDGLTLFFGSRREGWNGDHDGDIWLSQRANTAAAFPYPSNVGVLNSSGIDFPVSLSADGCSLYFASNRRFGGGGNQVYELYEARRQASPSSVTITMNVSGNGSGSVLFPYNCAIGNSGTCSVTKPFGSLIILNASRQATWSGACGPNGSPGLSTDAIVQYDFGGTCNVVFP